MLRIYRPDETDLVSKPVPVPVARDVEEPLVEDDTPVLLNFEEWSRRLRRPTQARAVRRARRLHENALCPQCQSPVIIPLELNNGRIDSAGDSVPGTASLVGFRCERCETEWPA